MFRKKIIKPCIAIVGDSSVRDVIQTSPNRFVSVVHDSEVYAKNHPVEEMCTDLEILRAAGIEPNFINCGNLLTPSNPATLGRLASDKLVEVASHVIDNEDSINS